MSADELKAALEAGFERVEELTTRWHAEEPAFEGDAAHLRDAVLMEHLVNFRLWHVEDEARRTDVDDSVIADCKRRIDALNQRRNDLMEKVDEAVNRAVLEFLPDDAREASATETLGAALDRLSILALKIFHMREQAERSDVDEAHRTNCAKKLAVLERQRDDLRAAILGLVDEYAAGDKRPRVYYQFKMYNDPALNPAVYGAKSGGSHKE